MRKYPFVGLTNEERLELKDEQLEFQRQVIVRKKMKYTVKCWSEAEPQHRYICSFCAHRKYKKNKFKLHCLMCSLHDVEITENGCCPDISLYTN